MDMDEHIDRKLPNDITDQHSARGAVTNPETLLAAIPPANISELVAHYKLTELMLERSAGEERSEYEKAYSTKKNYRFYLDGFILPRWGRYGISDIVTCADDQ